MTIRARLLLSALVPLFLGLLTIVMLYRSHQEIDRKNEQVDIQEDLARGVFELIILNYDYLINPSERAWLQWQSEYNRVSENFDSLEGAFTGQVGAFKRLAVDLKSIGDIFDRIVEYKSRNLSSEMAKKLEDRSVGQLMTHSRMLITEVHRMSHMNKLNAEKIHREYEWMVSAALVFLVAFTSVTAWIIGQSVLNPIRVLQQGVGVVAKGDLTYRVPQKGKDEISALGMAFNRMTEHLQKVYSDLNAEIMVRRAAEENLVALNQTLEKRVHARTLQLEVRNKELDAFAYVASHDLKSPLRAIDNLASWVMEDLGKNLPDGSKRHLALMRERVGRLEKLLDDLLHYSRAGRYEYHTEQVDVGAMVGSLVDLLRGESTLQFEIASDLPIFETVKPPFLQVFQNLINNAIKYHDKSNGRIEVGWKDAGAFYQFWVADDGPGIAPEFHAKVFEMFQKLQSRDDIDGTGMGLAVVKKSVESYEGKMHLISDVGEGARFEFTWPKMMEERDENEQPNGECVAG